MLHPGARVLDAHCFDALSAATVCGDTTVYSDAAGRRVRDLRIDIDLTDVGASGSTARITDYRFDRLGQLTSIADPEGATWSYGYDTFGNRTSSNDPGLGIWSMTYDNAGNLAQQTDAAGNEVAFTYDALNRVTLKRVGTGGNRVETRFTYDQARLDDNNQPYPNVGLETTQEVWVPTAGGTTIHRVERDYNRFASVARERHSIDGRTYEFRLVYSPAGDLVDRRLPDTPGGISTSWVGQFTFDAAGRITAWPGRISAVTYDLWGNPTRTDYTNGTFESVAVNSARGWVSEILGYQPDDDGNTPPNPDLFFRAAYSRTATGQIAAYDSGFTWENATFDRAGAYAFTYNYAGRVLTAANTRNEPTFSEVYTYDRAGRMRSKGNTLATAAAYVYGAANVPLHAPASVGGAALAYDANGNMTTGLGGKAMAYDRENRPLSVTFAGKRTCYVYGADSARLKKIENLAANQDCATIPASVPVTLYFGPVEIRGFKSASEQIITYPHPAVRLVHTGTSDAVNWLHRDHLGSIRAITNEAGAKIEGAVYRPFGAQTETVAPANPAIETRGFIGERYDADAGLQYLNARYYDPVLALFIQPDWFEVMQPGVGTNRFAYSGNDPVNRVDPGGNAFGGSDQHERPDAQAGHTGGTSFSGGETGGNGGRALTGFDRFVAGLFGWDVDALEAYEGSGLRNQGVGFGEFQRAVNAVKDQVGLTASFSTQGGPVNPLTGMRGVQLVAARLVAQGHFLWGFEVRTMVPGFSTPRIYDIVYAEQASGLVIGVEVKSTIVGTIALNPDQVAKDVVVASKGGYAPGFGTIRGVSYATTCFGCANIDFRSSAARLISDLTNAGIKIRHYE